MDADFRVRTETHALVLRLAAPSLDSQSGVTLGQAEIQNGKWSGRSESVPTSHGVCTVHVPATSAVIVRLKG
jgi:Glycosyl hydrolase family 79 C-terminal beta domain